MEKKLPRAKVTWREDITETLMILKLRPPRDFIFVPGQYCTVGLKGIERPYSIASSPTERDLELMIELVPHGALTPKLWQLKAGSTVSIRPRAKGIFTLENHLHHHVMVGTVTGITPFVSIIRYYLADGIKQPESHQFYVLHGASYQDELGYREYLETLARKLPFVKYVPTVSRPQEPRNLRWSGQTGRVNLILEEWLDNWDLPYGDTMIYLCGNPGMIEDARARAQKRGYKTKEEQFWSM